MKSLIAVAALAAAAVAAPAFAQTVPTYLAPVSYYASAGYTGINWLGNNLGAVTLRAGADLGKYVGVEGEAGFGVADAGLSYPGIGSAKLHLDNQYAGYVVGRYPVLPNANLFARVGYGHDQIKASATGVNSVTTGEDSLNYGVGGQYLFDAKNGLRLEWTRYDFRATGSTPADAWTLSYVRKF
jgi:outer membrane immunogenic protein